MSALTTVILITLFVILTLFITPDTVVTYPRDRLLSLRNHTALLNHGQRSLVSQLGLRRRGCRARAHCQRRLQVARSVTSSTTCTSTRGEIPTIVGHRVVFVNKHQLIDARHNVGVLKPLTEALPRTVVPDVRRCKSRPSYAAVRRLSNTSVSSSEPAYTSTDSEFSLSFHCQQLNNVNDICELRTEKQNVVSISTSCNKEKEETHNGSVPAVIASQNLSPQNVSTYILLESLSVQRQTSNQENERVLSQPRLPSVQAMVQPKSKDNPSLYQYDSHISDLSSPTSCDMSLASIRSIQSIPSSLVDTDDVCYVLDKSHDFSRGDLSLSNCSSNYTWIYSSPQVRRFIFPTVLLANLRGGLCTKLDELSVMLRDNCVDIAVLTETWLHEGIIDDVIEIAGYCLHRRDRQDGRVGGGAAVYVRQGLPCIL